MICYGLVLGDLVFILVSLWSLCGTKCITYTLWNLQRYSIAAFLKTVPMNQDEVFRYVTIMV